MDLQYSSKKFLKSIREKPGSFQRSTYTTMGSPQSLAYSSYITSSHSQQLNEFPGVKFRKNTSPLDANDERKQLIFGTIRGLKRFKRHSDLSEIFGRKQQRTDNVSLCLPNLPKEYTIDSMPDDEASFNQSLLVAPEIVQEVPKCKQSIQRLEGLEDLQKDSKFEIGNPLRDRHLSPYARTSSTITTRSMSNDAGFRARRRPLCQPDPSAESEGAFVKRCSKVLDQIIHEEKKFLDTSDGEPQSILSARGDALFNNEKETTIDTNLHHQKEMRDDFDKENNVQGQPCTSSAPDMEELGVPAGLCGGVAETNSSREMRVFKRVLREPALRKPFQLFLEQQFCAENLNFYVAVEQFHDLPHESTSRAAIENRELVARRIYERHFAPNSMEPVNVDNSTSKRIREAISAQHYHRTVFDVAQYQIFHLLKYDCWPRYLKAGGIAPEFSDEELADDADRKDSDGRGDHDDQAGPSGGGGKEKGRGWASSAIAALAGSGSPNSSTKEKRRSGGFWQGFDRISRRLKKDGQSETHQGSRSSGGAGSPVAEKRHSQVHRTSSSKGGSSNEERRKSYSSELEDECCSTTGGRPGVSSVGSRRRHLFSQGKQISMPAEIHAQISSHRVAPRVVKKSCTLMIGDSCSSEMVELDDPSFSVAKWTQTVAVKLGLDAKCCEAVDAQTGCTIDPCRQAIDALQNRFVRIVPVVTMAIEILPSNFNFKNPQSTPPKIVLLRARHSLSTAAALRPLLAKYSVDLTMIVVVIGGTLEQISRLSVTIGNIGSKTLTVMSQAQFQERQQGKEMGRINWKDPLGSIPPEQSALLQYHQHGDVSYCEIASEAERAKLKGEHSLGLTKFLRKASAAVTNKDEPPKEQKTSLKGTQATGVRRRSVGQGVASGVYCGEEPQNDPNQKEPAKKRLSIFKNKGEERSGGEKSPIPGTRRSPQMGVRSGEKEKETNGDTPRTPAIYATKIINDEDVDSGAFIWQPAAYV